MTDCLPTHSGMLKTTRRRKAAQVTSFLGFWAVAFASSESDVVSAQPAPAAQPTLVHRIKQAGQEGVRKSRIDNLNPLNPTAKELKDTIGRLHLIKDESTIDDSFVLIRSPFFAENAATSRGLEQEKEGKERDDGKNEDGNNRNNKNNNQGNKNNNNKNNNQGNKNNNNKNQKEKNENNKNQGNKDNGDEQKAQASSVPTTPPSTPLTTSPTLAPVTQTTLAPVTSTVGTGSGSISSPNPTIAPTLAPLTSTVGTGSGIISSPNPTLAPTLAPLTSTVAPTKTTSKPTKHPTKSPTPKPTKAPSTSPTESMVSSTGSTSSPTSTSRTEPSSSPTKSTTPSPLAPSTLEPSNELVSSTDKDISETAFFTVGFSVAIQRGLSARIDSIAYAASEVLGRDTDYNVLQDVIGGSRHLYEGGREKGTVKKLRGERRRLGHADSISLKYNAEESVAVYDVVDIPSLSDVTWHTYLLKYNIFPCTADHARNGSTNCAADTTVIGYQAESVVLESVMDGRMLELLKLSNSNIVAVSRIGEEVEVSTMLPGEEGLNAASTGRNGYEPLETGILDPLRLAGITLFLITLFFTIILICQAKLRGKEREISHAWSSVLGSEGLGSEGDVQSFLNATAGKAMKISGDETSSDTSGENFYPGDAPAQFHYEEDRPIVYT